MLAQEIQNNGKLAETEEGTEWNQQINPHANNCLTHLYDPVLPFDTSLELVRYVHVTPPPPPRLFQMTNCLTFNI